MTHANKVRDKELQLPNTADASRTGLTRALQAPLLQHLQCIAANFTPLPSHLTNLKEAEGSEASNPHMSRMCVCVCVCVFIRVCIHYIVLHGSASQRVALHCVALHCIALHCIALPYIALHFMHYTKLHFIPLHYIKFAALHCTVLHCMAWHGMVLHCIAYKHTKVCTRQTKIKTAQRWRLFGMNIPTTCVTRPSCQLPDWVWLAYPAFR